MNLKKYFIAGFLLITISFIGAKSSHADFCAPGNSSSYKSTYCQMQMNDNGNADSEILATVSQQYGISEDTITQILEGTICKNVDQMELAERQKLPENVVIGCLPKKAGTGVNTITDQLLAQNFFADVQNSYLKEKAMFFNKMSLKAKFKASEKYWDGKIGGPQDAPFDLMTDLNLIDIVLFGSKAKWNGDVYKFPNKEDEQNQEGVPLDGLIEGGEEAADNQQNNEEGGEKPIECVPVGDPEADSNSQPVQPLCGNGSIDILMGETCDDGNKNSGDGCNQFCQAEANGANNMCQDPDAITFKQATKVSGTGNGNETENGCPAGTVPKKQSSNQSVENVPQAEEYPGPFIGGTLKQFPESERPICGPGTSPLEITVAGKKQIATDGNGDPRCLPTNFCSDPDTVRTFLAATSFPFPVGPITAAEWKQLPEDDPIRKSLEAIEVVNCVNVIKENRPLMYYNPNEGCIDCHISAMADALERALSTNVTPLANTTKAFGLSTRFGPNFSFNLMTTVKPKLKLTPTTTGVKAVESSVKAIEDTQEQANLPQTTLPQEGTDATTLEQKDIAQQNAIQEMKEALRIYHQSNGAIADMELNARIEPLITQMRSSFESLQSKYQGMVESTALNETPQCR